MSAIVWPDYAKEIAIEELRLEALQSRVENLATGEINRLLRTLADRFKRHRFEFNIGNGTYHVKVSPPLFGDRWGMLDSFYDFHFTRAEELSEAFTFLRETVEKIEAIADSVWEVFHTTPDSVALP